MTEPVNTSGRADGGALAPLSDEAFEASRLLLELMHVTYASRGSAVADTWPGKDAAGGPRPPASTHAIRAAIHIYQRGELTVGELASGLGISYGWASRVISELEDARMVVRASDGSDRRVVRVRLTPAAIAMAENAYRWRGEAVERALASLDDEGRRAVLTFLRTVIEELAQAAQDRRSATG